MNMKLSPQRRSAGFTLLEIMLVVMIIALLAGAAIYNMGDTVGEAKKVRADADIKSIGTSLMMYSARNGFYPSSSQGLQALVVRPSDEPKPRNWSSLMKEVAPDPWGMEYQYVEPGTHNTGSYDLFSMGPDHKAGTDDDIGNWPRTN